jgi:alkylation response protein AidB-like acyl-CoA dehydrogenase
MRLANWAPAPRPQLGPFGTECPLSEQESATVDRLRHFAESEMRPTGELLDRMAPEEVVARGSPLWGFYAKFQDLGFTVDQMLALEPGPRARAMCLAYEVLGWGDAGLACSVGAASLPRYLARLFGNDYLAELCPDSSVGCWGITEPDHGSDALDPAGLVAHAGGSYGRPNCVAVLKPDRVVINGRKSAWVSNGPVAQVCLLYCAADTGAGPDPRHGAAILVPCDARGVSRGKPLDKMGQRALPQGELFFDNVELGIEYLLAGPEHFLRAVYAVHAEANALMGACFAGVAQRAYELALAYAHQRRQGGVPLVRHQHVGYRLFHMFRKVEAARALARRVCEYNMVVPQPALHASMAAKVTATQTAFEVANDALQMFGGLGLTRAYPLEKLLRDARASLLEDGCNEVLSILGGAALVDPDRL